jgi:RNA polymerase sigma-70 factor, ECF subfamily
MSALMHDSTIDLPYSSATDASLSTTVPGIPIEEEVIILFDQLRNRLFRYVLSLGVYAHDGEDIIQEVFLSLFRHLQLGRSRANLRGWIFRVAHNLALKHRNGNARRQTKLESDSGLAEIHLDPTANPEEQLADFQRQQRLLAIVRALPEQDQWCLYLRAEGLRYREIASALEMSLGAVSNSLARSIARLERADGR